MYTLKDSLVAWSKDLFVAEVKRLFYQFVEISVRNVLVDVGRLGVKQFTRLVIHHIFDNIIGPVKADDSRKRAMNTIRDVVEEIMSKAGAALLKRKRELSDGRACAECGGSMRLNDHHTRLWDFWTCSKCGYWDCTKHAPRRWMRRKGK